MASQEPTPPRYNINVPCKFCSSSTVKTMRIVNCFWIEFETCPSERISESSTIYKLSQHLRASGVTCPGEDSPTYEIIVTVTVCTGPAVIQAKMMPSTDR